MFMTAWVFEAHHCPTLLNEIKKTKLQTYTSPQAGINILLWRVFSLQFKDSSVRQRPVNVIIVHELNFTFIEK